MREDDVLWVEEGAGNGWLMPTASWWKRLPIIRRIRAAYHERQIEKHNAMFRALGMIPQGYDAWVIYGIARGFERPPE